MRGTSQNACVLAFAWTASAGYARPEIIRTACPEIAVPPASNAIDISRNIPYIVAAAKTERGSHDNWQGRSCRA
jgi:hypothetical protein